MMKLTTKILLFCGLPLLIGGAVYLFRDQVLAPLAQRLLVRTVRAKLGMEVTVATISGTYVRDLRLTGVRTAQPSSTGMLVSIEAASITATYSLPLLLEGVDIFLADLRLELDGAWVAMDFTRGGEGAGPEGTAPSPALALALPVGRARDSGVALRGRDWALTLSGMDLTVGPFDDRQGGFPLAVHAAQSVIELPALHRQTPELAARGMLRRDSVRVDRLEVNGEPALEAARFDYGPAEPFSLAVSFTAFGGSGKIHGMFAEEATTLDWDLRTVDLAAVARLLVQAEALPTGRLTSSGSLVGDLSDPVSLTAAATLAVTDGTLRTIPFKQLALAGTGAAGILRLDSLTAAMDRNVLAASGVSVPLAALVAGDAEKILVGARGRFNLSLEDIPSLLRQVGVAAAGKEYLAGGIPAHHLVVAGEATADGITLESGSFSAGRAAVDLERGLVSLPRTGPLLAGLGLSVKLTARIPDLDRISSIFGVTESAGSFEATVSLDGPLAHPRGAITVRGRDLRYRAGRLDSLLLEARSGPAGWRIDNLEAVNGADRLAGHGIVALAPVRFNGMVLDLNLRDFQPYLGWFMAGEAPPARGGLAAHLELSGAPLAPTGSFRAILGAATIGGVAIAGGELAGTVAGEKIAVASLMVRTESGRVELAGTMRHRTWGLPVIGTIERLTLDYADLRLQLREPVAVTVDGKTAWSFEPATLQGAGGTLRLGGGLTPQKGYDIGLGLSEVSSETLRVFFAELPFAFRGFNLEGTLTGPLDAPEAALSGSVTELWVSEEFVALAGQFDVRISARGIAVRKFAWTTKAGERVVLVGAVPYDPLGRHFIPGQLDLAGDFSVPDLGVLTIFLPEKLRLRGALTGTMRLAGTSAHPEAAIKCRATEISLPAAVVPRPPGPVTVEVEAVFKDNDLRIDKLVASSKELTVSVAGSWRAAGDLLKGPSTAGLPGVLDLKGAVMVDDIGWLGRGIGGIRRLGGHLDGTMALAGPAAGPELTADISFVGGEFRAEGAMPPLRDIEARFRIAQRTATIDRFTGTVGGSPFAVAGRMVLPGTGAPAADLRVHGANLLLYRGEGVKVRADTDITVRGPLTALAFAGTIALSDSWLQKNVNWLAPIRDIGRRKRPVNGAALTVGIGVSFPNPPLRDATFAIHVLSKNPFRLKSNVARGELRPDLWLRGTGEVPLLTGVIYVDSSRIMLPAGRLSIDSGLIRFPEKNLGRPVLEISGASRIFGYDIKVMIEGPHDDPVVTLSSVPPLPQDALLLLLLTGKLPPGLVEQAGGWQGGMSLALYVSKGVLQEWFGGNDLDVEESKLERFDVVIGRGISRQGNETIGAQYRLADGVIKDGDELFLVAERDIYDEFNTGLRIVFKFK